MRLAASQLRQIIREELSQLSGVIAEDKYAGYRCGNNEFDTAQEAITYADRMSGLKGAHSINVERIDTDEIIYTTEDGFLGGVVELIHEINPAEETAYTAGEGADGKLIDEYGGSRDDTRGGYGNWKGFTPMDAEKLAIELAAKSRNREVGRHSVDMKDLIAAAKKFTSSKDARDGIISWLVGKGFGNGADYR